MERPSPLQNLYSTPHTSHHCTLCTAQYSTARQLSRHTRDRHGPQKSCGHCSFKYPESRKDYYQRHLRSVHKIQPSCPSSPAVPSPSDSSVIQPTAIAATTTTTIPAFCSDIPSPEPLSFDLYGETAQSSQPTTTTLHRTPPFTPPPIMSIADLLNTPPLLKTNFSNEPMPSLPIIPLPTSTQTDTCKQTSAQNTTPAEPTEEAYTPGSPAHAPTYTPTSVQTNSYTAPQFPPPVLDRPPRKPLSDPRLLFRDAPSSFYKDSLALMARRIRTESRDHDVDVSFECNGWSITRKETVVLSGQRQYTMVTTLTPHTPITQSRHIATETEIPTRRCECCAQKAEGCGTYYQCQ